jgi:hypothetical protein
MTSRRVERDIAATPHLPPLIRKLTDPTVIQVTDTDVR